MISYYIYEMEGERFLENVELREPFPFFRTVASAIAMSDVTDINVTKVVYDDKEYRYNGWAPGMVFTFTENGNADNAYTVYMDHLDH